MTTSIDTNILAALWDPDDTLHRAARKILDDALEKGQLVICGVVHAELVAAPGRTAEFVDRFCEETGIKVEWEIGEKVWRATGAAFQSYTGRRRKQTGSEPRRILADFLIGAHAMVNGHRLLTLDGRWYRASFPKLLIVQV